MLTSTGPLKIAAALAVLMLLPSGSAFDEAVAARAHGQVQPFDFDGATLAIKP